MSQVARELSERIQFFGLLLHASHFAHTIEQNAHKPFRQRWNGLEHLRKQRSIKLKPPGWGRGITQAAVSLHAREGKQAGDQTGEANEKSGGLTMLATHVDLALEQDDHLGGGVPFAEVNSSGFSEHFRTASGQPLVVRLLQVVERSHFFERFNDFGNSCRVVWRTVGWGRRRETWNRGLGRHGTSRCCS